MSENGRRGAIAMVGAWLLASAASAAPGDVVSSFPVPAGVGYGVDWDPEDDTLWVVSDGFGPGEPLLFHLDPDGTLLDSFTLPNAGTGNGVTVVGPLVYVTDFNGDLETYDDHVMAIDKLTGELVAFWSVDDTTCVGCVPNPNPDDAIDQIVGIEHVEADLFLVSTFLDPTVRRIQLVIDAPPTASSSWQTVESFTNGSEETLAGLEVGAVSGTLGTSPTSVTIVRFDEQFQVIETIPGPGTFPGGITERGTDGRLFHVDVGTNLVYELEGFPSTTVTTDCQGALPPGAALPYGVTLANGAPFAETFALQQGVVLPDSTFAEFPLRTLGLAAEQVVEVDRLLPIPATAGPGDYQMQIQLLRPDLSAVVAGDACPFRVLPAGWLECAAETGEFDDVPFNVGTPVGPQDFFATRLSCAGAERPLIVREIAIFSEDLIPFTPGFPPFARAGVAPPDLGLDPSGRTPDLDAAVVDLDTFPVCPDSGGCFVTVPVDGTYTAAADPVVFVQFPPGDLGSIGVGGSSTPPFDRSASSSDGFASPAVPAGRNWGMRIVVETPSGLRRMLPRGGTDAR